MDDSAIRWDKTPDLRLPVLFAAWPGMGNVSLNAARFLLEKLDVERLGTIESTEFCAAEGISVREHLVVPLEIPEYRFYAFRHPEDKGDLLLFVGDHQPLVPQSLTLARLILKVADRFGVRRVYTSAALMCSMSHMERPRVWGIATHREILPELERIDVRLLPEGQVSGLNGLLLGVARRMGFEGVCLLGEVPYYTIGMDNPKSTLAVLERFARLWQIPLDTGDLHEAGLRKEMEIEQFIRQGDKDFFLGVFQGEGGTREDGGTKQYN